MLNFTWRELQEKIKSVYGATQATWNSSLTFRQLFDFKKTIVPKAEIQMIPKILMEIEIKELS